MTISWITGIYNNSGTNMYMWAEDSRNLGVVFNDRDGAEVGKNDNQEVVTLLANHHYRAEFCGIPWYHDERHFRALSTDPGRDKRNALLLWQSIVDESDGVVLINGQNMKPIGGHEFGTGGDRRYALHIDDASNPENGPVEISLELRNTNDTTERVLSLLGKGASDLYDDLRQLRVEAGRAALKK